MLYSHFIYFLQSIRRHSELPVQYLLSSMSIERWCNVKYRTEFKANIEWYWSSLEIRISSGHNKTSDLTRWLICQQGDLICRFCLSVCILVCHCFLFFPKKSLRIWLYNGSDWLAEKHCHYWWETSLCIVKRNHSSDMFQTIWNAL